MALPILDGNQTATTLSTVLTSGEHIPAHTVVSLGSVAISNITSAVSGSVVSISNFPSTQTIAGTVTVGSLPDGVSFGQQLAEGYDNYGGAPVQIVGSSITQSISGTVTANVYVAGYDQYYEEKTELPVISFNQPINTAASDKTIPVQIANDFGTLNSTNPLPISGTVTANNPSGALTTRFGSVATANLAFITSAVTNTSRKYLLAQNISAGTVTIGIGFSPTTTQGIQLSAGGGLTFDAFCPTGAVYWLGAVTGANYCLIEG